MDHVESLVVVSLVSLVAARRRVEVSRSLSRGRADTSRGGAPRAVAPRHYIPPYIRTHGRIIHDPYPMNTRPPRTTTTHPRVPVHKDENTHRAHRSDANGSMVARWTRFSKIMQSSARETATRTHALVRLALDDDDASSKPAIEGVAVAVAERETNESGGGERGRWGRRPRPRTTDADR